MKKIKGAIEKKIKDLAILSVTQLIDLLVAYEQRLKRCEEDSVKNVFQSKLKLWP